MEEVPPLANDSTEPLEEPVPSGLTTREAKRRCLYALCILSAITGVLDSFITNPQLERVETIGVMVVSLILLVSWCNLDSRERGYVIPRPLKLLIILLAGLGVPIYLLRTRGFRGLLSILLVLAFLGVLVVIAATASVATSYVVK